MLGSIEKSMGTEFEHGQLEETLLEVEREAEMAGGDVIPPAVGDKEVRFQYLSNRGNTLTAAERAEHAALKKSFSRGSITPGSNRLNQKK